MAYYIRATFFIITNNSRLVQQQDRRTDTHYTLKAMLGSRGDLSRCVEDKIDRKSMVTLLIDRAVYQAHECQLKTGYEVSISGTVIMHDKNFHPIYVDKVHDIEGSDENLRAEKRSA